MTRLTLSIAAAFFAASPAWAIVPVGPATPAPAVAPPRPTLGLKFNKVPLGNVMRVFSARFGGVPLTVEARATAPISGDFSGDDVQTAVSAAARQAGLFTVPLGATPAAGFRLTLHPPPPAPVASTVKSAPIGGPAPGPSEAERRRTELLRQRAQLLQAAAKLDE
jgi:hypothetical protein